MVRIPIDGTTSGVDHFIPGLAVDPSTSGSSAHLGLTYYYYPQAKCTTATCQLEVGFIASADGGVSWGAATQLAGPMTLTWLPSTTQGYMVGDYIATSFSAGKAFPVFVVAAAGSGSQLNESLTTVQGGLAFAGGVRPAISERAVFRHPVRPGRLWTAF